MRLLVIQESRLALLDVDTGRVTPLATDARLQGYTRINAVAVGSEVVMVGDDSTGAGGGGGTVLATTARPGSPSRAIGESDPQLVVSERPGRIWLTATTDADPRTGRPRTQLTEVDLRGKAHRRVGLDAFGAHPFGTGFLTDLGAAGGSGVVLLDAAGRRTRSWPEHQLVDVAGRWALLVPASCRGRCALRLLTVAAGAVSEPGVRAHADPAAWGGRWLSPDGAYLVTEVSRATAAEPPRVQVTALSDGTTGALPGIQAPQFFGLQPTFSRDGRWALFADADRRHVNACLLRERRCYRVRAALDRITSVVALG